MRAIVKESRIFIYDSYAHKESIKGIPGRYWHVEEKAWSVPLNIDNIETLNILGCILPDDKNFEGFTGYDILDLLEETLDKLEKLYRKDQV